MRARCLTFYHGNVHFEAERRKGACVFKYTRRAALCVMIIAIMKAERARAASRAHQSGCLFVLSRLVRCLFSMFSFVGIHGSGGGVRSTETQKKKHIHIALHVTQLHLHERLDACATRKCNHPPREMHFDLCRRSAVTSFSLIAFVSHALRLCAESSPNENVPSGPQSEFCLYKWS